MNGKLTSSKDERSSTYVSNTSLSVQGDLVPTTTFTRQRSHNMASQSRRDVEPKVREDIQVISRGQSLEDVLTPPDSKCLEEETCDSSSEYREGLPPQSLNRPHYNRMVHDELSVDKFLSCEGLRLDMHDSFPPVTTISREEWLENVDLDFLDDIDLVSSDDDEIDFKKREMSIEEYKSKFFKLFHDVLRKDKLILNSQLPKWEQKGIMSIFKSQGAHVRQVAKLLQKCHKTAYRCFNFQRYSFIICTESNVGDGEEEIEICVNTIPKIFKFQVDRYSTIDCLSMFDFSAFCNTDSNFLASTNTSPYLSLTIQQWKRALKEKRVGRWIMMYDPIAVNLLKKQGEKAQQHAAQLEQTHLGSKLFKLVLSEYMYKNRREVMNNMSFKGSEVIRSMRKVKKNRDLFKAIPKWVADFEQYVFVLNPANSKKRRTWSELISDENPSAGEKVKSSKKTTILLCDPIHWTMYMMLLLDERVQTLITLLAGTAKVNKGWEQNDSASETVSQIRDVKTLGKEHLAKLRQLLEPLPKLESLEAYAAKNQGNFFFEGMDANISNMSLCLATAMISHRSERLESNTESSASRSSGSRPRSSALQGKDGSLILPSFPE